MITTVVSTGMRDGKPFSITAEIDSDVIARREAAAAARRAQKTGAPAAPTPSEKPGS